MGNNLFQFSLSTNKSQEFIDITYLVKQALEQSGIRSGIAVIYCPHTTAGITINENGDPDVVRDILSALDKVFPIEGDYRHFEGNSHAHLKSSYMGAEKTVIINEGKLLLGTWQSLYFCEFDGPRTRKLLIKMISDEWESRG
ncbi:secondary thiamine-phosphate synthase enzyme [Geosporobacter subterraneus DSM 17957]|uniref:Secondary thiamine-phosphate synthase enzyme n=1 Tax=Geosporobacter subterraneus DSM 17957 TaxID=1121919 RepID=A0A1M6KZV4_9FIRM|nr:secondary thiamine-phosphate synthase enzyme YjbQ [Geosporobacter subterraneus]SHJ64389.1 secondary thiamine-phosphate synthase enzyme [Geosporobacter subterraneus DSM 17957]